MKHKKRNEQKKIIKLLILAIHILKQTLEPLYNNFKFLKY